MQLTIERERLMHYRPTILEYTPNPELQDQLFIPESEIQSKLRELAGMVPSEFPRDEELLAGFIHNGSFMLAKDFGCYLEDEGYSNIIPLFPRAESYLQDQTVSSGDVRLDQSFDLSVFRGENVLLMDDIDDTGFTRIQILQRVAQQKPKKVRYLTLLTKPDRRDSHVLSSPWMTGFVIPDAWVYGYGMDRVNNRDRMHRAIWVDNVRSGFFGKPSQILTPLRRVA